MNNQQEKASAEMKQVLDRESGLQRQLSSRQLAMIAIGGAIGTGLFLGSGLAVKLAGPGVIIAYAFGAVVALLMMGALSEMAVVHPTAGSFGVYAELYLNSWAGFAVRYSYWFAQVIATGSEIVAVAIYCQLWFPNVPGWIWIAAFSAGLVYVNARAVGNFGAFEYWFAMIKVVTIVIFIVLGVSLVFGFGFSSPIGLENLTRHGGFLPNGWKGVWLASSFVVFSYIGVEVVAVTSGEAKEPRKAIPRALRSMVARLVVFYLASITVLVVIVPWNETGLKVSPFVLVFQRVGIPAASHIMNFVVLTAALSSINTNLYLITRMMFSLARGGYAPKSFGRVTSRGVPINALLAGTFGLAIAAVVAVKWQQSPAYLYLLGVAFFGGLFVWAMIFITHLRFRAHRKRLGLEPSPIQVPFYPFTSVLGLILVVSLTLTTWWVPGLRITVVSGIPWLGAVTLCYYLWRSRRRAAVAREETAAVQTADILNDA